MYFHIVQKANPALRLAWKAPGTYDPNRVQRRQMSDQIIGGPTYRQIQPIEETDRTISMNGVMPYDQFLKLKAMYESSYVEHTFSDGVTVWDVVIEDLSGPPVQVNLAQYSMTLGVLRRVYPVATVGDSISMEAPVVASGYLRVLLTLADAVPGMPNAYYIDKGATDLGYNVALTPQGIPDIRLYWNGQEKLWGPQSSFDGPGTTVDFDIVRSLSTGLEGHAVLGSLNAILFNFSFTGTVWYYYRRAGLATNA
jgi:hypothetical protein